MTQDVIDGKLDFITEDPTGDQLPEVRDKYADRFRQDRTRRTSYYNFMNVTIPPFDKPEAREAINYAIDSRRSSASSAVAWQPGCNFIPPGRLGYKKTDCAYGDPNGPGDIEKAKELVKQSGSEAEHGHRPGQQQGPAPRDPDYFVDMLTQIGFNADSKTLDQQVYFSTIGQKWTKAADRVHGLVPGLPASGRLLRDAPEHAGSRGRGHVQPGFASDPEIDKNLDELPGKDPEDVADQWAELDDYVVNDKASVAPYGTEESSSFFSERMDPEDCHGVHPVYKNDWHLFCLK